VLYTISTIRVVFRVEQQEGEFVVFSVCSDSLNCSFLFECELHPIKSFTCKPTRYRKESQKKPIQGRYIENSSTQKFDNSKRVSISNITSSFAGTTRIASEYVDFLQFRDPNFGVLSNAGL